MNLEFETVVSNCFGRNGDRDQANTSNKLEIFKLQRLDNEVLSNGFYYCLINGDDVADIN